MSDPHRAVRATSSRPPRLHLTLYLAGAATARSMTAKRRLAALVAELDAEALLDVVDVLEAPDRAVAAQVVATPMLVRDLPPPGRRVVGDLANTTVVAKALGLDTLDGGCR